MKTKNLNENMKNKIFWTFFPKSATAVLYNIQKSFEPQPPMPSQEAFENLAKFDQLMALGPNEPIPNDSNTTFIRNRVIDKWFTNPGEQLQLLQLLWER